MPHYLTYAELVHDAIRLNEVAGKELREGYFATHEVENPRSRFYTPKWDNEVNEILNSNPKSEVTEDHKHLVKNKFCLLDLGIIAGALKDANSQDIRAFLEN